MKTYFLKFANEAQAIERLATFRSDDGWLTSSPEYALDVIGTIHQPTGAMLSSDDVAQYPELAPIEGFHVNLAIAELPEALMPFAVTPDHPIRVFA